MDLGRSNSIRAALAVANPALIINAAAYTNVEQAEDDAFAAYRVNCDGPVLLAKIGSERRIPMIHISSDYVFDGAVRRPYLEQDVLAPLNKYGKSKAAADRQLLQCSDCCTILRTAWLYSPYAGNFVTKILAAAERDAPLRVVDDQTGSPTYAATLAQAILAILSRCRDFDSEAFGLFNLADGGESTWFDLADAVLANSSSTAHRRRQISRVSSAEFPTRAARPKYSALDSSLAASKLGLRTTPWREALKTCLSRIEA
jgi:dTDP-4-dehydrorhamnose reductase